MFEVTLIVVIGLGCLSIVRWTLKIGISPMPSSTKACCAILKVSQEAPEGTIIDLGSGWGTLIFALARQYPDRQIIGYELSWLPWVYTMIYKTMFCFKNVTIHRQDFLNTPLPEASLLVCYLFPKGMIDLQRKLIGEPCFGSMLISSTFALPDSRAIKTIQLDDLYKTSIYVYQ